jgi:hypothetical protein
LIVATLDKVDFLEGKNEAAPFYDLMKEIIELRSEWAEKVVGYEVRR